MAIRKNKHFKNRELNFYDIIFIWFFFSTRTKLATRGISPERKRQFGEI